MKYEMKRAGVLPGMLASLLLWALMGGCANDAGGDASNIDSASEQGGKTSGNSGKKTPATTVVHVESVTSAVSGSSFAAEITFCIKLASLKVPAGVYKIDSIWFDPNNSPKLWWYDGPVSLVSATRLQSWTPSIEAPSQITFVTGGFITQAGEPVGFDVTLTVGDTVGLVPTTIEGVHIVGALQVFQVFDGIVDAQGRGFLTGHGATTLEEFGAVVSDLFEAISPQLNAPDFVFSELECPYDFPVPKPDTPSQATPEPGDPYFIELGQDAEPKPKSSGVLRAV